GGKNSLNRLIRCVCGKKIGPDPRNFNQRVSLGRNDLLIRTFPRPFGIVFGFNISGNSLDSLKENWMAHSKAVHDVNYFCNLICVLGKGVLRYEKVNLTIGEKDLLLDTDEFVNLVLTAHKRRVNSEENDQIVLRIVKEGMEDQSFGRFFTYLLIMLTRMKLNVPDIGRYIDPNLPLSIVRE
ncbi:hypothetical protein, partial [Klebsiella pneumoniae]|uniref:hypothetical protein n=1 Tax=Klebsiella pneumoniae TaxID=573 RepID=UPI0015C4E65B